MGGGRETKYDCNYMNLTKKKRTERRTQSDISQER